MIGWIRRWRWGLHLVAAASFALSGCGGGGGNGSSTTTVAPLTATNTGTSLAYTPPAQQSLTVADVQQILAQAVAQARADGKPAVISVTDRVGNVLALFRMTGAPSTAHITDAPNGQDVDVQGLDVPAEASAIAKAITGAYLSSGGNAFSSRTASMIVQTQFPPEPATTGLGSGPLYGVQFSQLPCSDLSSRYMASGTGALIGPKRSPLGLSADPGGFPLYKNGVIVGGIGVEADGLYSFDPNVQQTNLIVDERIAIAGTRGFDAPAAITADQIYVAGVKFIYTDVTADQVSAGTGASFADALTRGSLEALTGYTGGGVVAGTAYGTEASGIRASTTAEFPNPDAYVLSNGAGANRYPVRAATDGADVGGAALSANEAQTILAQAFLVMSKARAQIRNPLNSFAEVTISLVDTRGQVLGIVRAPDAPIFGTDVSLQKARTAAFFSNAAAGAQLLAAQGTDVPHFVGAARTFLNDPTALTGKFAFSDRAGGDLSRPNFPDGTVGRPNGPFSRPIDQFNPFSTGLQSALIVGNLAAHLAYVTGQSASDTPQRCTTVPDVVAGQNRLANGIQIFPGSVPVYRNGTLIGGLGISGDGIDQDDMISFLGLNNAGVILGNGIGNAPMAIRADQIVVQLGGGDSARLRFVSCPNAPFVNSDAQNVCQGL